ncbi:hypothetical protein PROFUN_04901 [Planoprotostelium fungivorum]|uniref:Amino acid permease/ SLC12A domain-containing protein n=1 Tax=Planoprotostelium fungivorum TaxID=1890364 RepID=A0A2P6NF58_9EUKA|nr:hypothetical protein PROFUN_04901 [Planoprotostelium fungivorum]
MVKRDSQGSSSTEDGLDRGSQSNRYSRVIDDKSETSDVAPLISNPFVDAPQNDAAASDLGRTKRLLGARHMMIIALGGAIGTGIFLFAGASIAIAGPGTTLLSYATVGLFVYSVIMQLGEMASFLPTSGAFASFGSRYVSQGFGFALGIGYYFQWAFSIPSELTAAAVILQFWAPHIDVWVWALIIIIPMFLIQFINVRVWGEVEYWSSLGKILLILVFILIGILYDAGAMGSSHPGPGLSNFTNGAAFIGGFGGFIRTFVNAFYSFGGAELVALAAGECEKPHRTVPIAIKATFFRIFIFFILSIFVMGLCINYKDPILNLYTGDAAASPITIIFQRAGFGPATHVVNAVLVTAILSATNSCFFATSRMMMTLAREEKLPRVFGWVNGRGVPVPALFVTLLISSLTFLTSIWGEGVVFQWFLNLTGMSALVTWTSIAIISVRFRRGLKLQGYPLSDLPYKQPLYPLLPILTLISGAAMFVGNAYVSIAINGGWKNFVATFSGLGLFTCLWCGWELTSHLRFKYGRADVYRGGFVDLQCADYTTDAVWDKAQGERILEEDRMEVEREKRSMPRWKWYMKSIY